MIFGYLDSLAKYVGFQKNSPKNAIKHIKILIIITLNSLYYDFVKFKKIKWH